MWTYSITHSYNQHFSAKRTRNDNLEKSVRYVESIIIAERNKYENLDLLENFYNLNLLNKKNV